MNALICITSLLVMAIFMKKSIHWAIMGWLGFCMRGLSFGKESLIALFWIAFQCVFLYLVITHIPFTISWK